MDIIFTVNLKVTNKAVYSIGEKTILTRFFIKFLLIKGWIFLAIISLEYIDIYPFIEGYLIVNFISLING